MKSFHDLAVGRRSIRRYTTEEISAEDVRTLLEAGLLAPTSKNKRPWHFVLVEDGTQLAALAKCKPSGAASVGHCALAIVVAVDVEQSEAWIEDASVAATFIMLQASDLGLGSCWVQLLGRQTADDDVDSTTYVQNMLDMPDHIIPLCIVTVGHPDEQRQPQNTEKLLWEKVHIGTWKER